MRVAVLASGGGSNLQALLEHFDRLGADAPGRVVLVVSDRSAAGALEKARARGIPTAYLPKSTPDAALGETLDAHRIDVVVLAGYLRLVPADVVRRWQGRMVNVHPALLPAFGGPGMYGHHVHEAVVAADVSESGPTVHFVDEVFDRGAIIAQQRVPVHRGDTPTDVAARVLRAEHELYPRCVEALCRGEVRLSAGGEVLFADRGEKKL